MNDRLDRNLASGLDGHPSDGLVTPPPATAPGDIITMYRELAAVTAGDGADPMLRAVLALTIAIDRHMHTLVEQQARIADALERLVDMDLGAGLAALSDGRA